MSVTLRCRTEKDAERLRQFLRDEMHFKVQSPWNPTTLVVVEADAEQQTPAGHGRIVPQNERINQCLKSQT